MSELRVTIQALVALDDLGVALQAEPLGLEQFAHHHVATVWPCALSSSASTRRLLPLQRSGDSGSPRAHGINPCKPVRHQRRILVRQRLATTAAASYRSRRRQRYATQERVGLDFKPKHAGYDGPARQPSCSSHPRDTAAPDDLGLYGRVRAPLSLIQTLPHHFPALLYRRHIWHGRQAQAVTAQCTSYLLTIP